MNSKNTTKKSAPNLLNLPGYFPPPSPPPQGSPHPFKNRFEALESALSLGQTNFLFSNSDKDFESFFARQLVSVAQPKNFQIHLGVSSIWGETHRNPLEHFSQCRKKNLLLEKDVTPHLGTLHPSFLNYSIRNSLETLSNCGVISLFLENIDPFFPFYGEGVEKALFGAFECLEKLKSEGLIEEFGISIENPFQIFNGDIFLRQFPWIVESAKKVNFNTGLKNLFLPGGNRDFLPYFRPGSFENGPLISLKETLKGENIQFHLLRFIGNESSFPPPPWGDIFRERIQGDQSWLKLFLSAPSWFKTFISYGPDQFSRIEEMFKTEPLSPELIEDYFSILSQKG